MTNSNKKKAIQLGMPWATAYNKLKKMILFGLLQKANSNVCFQCGKKIEKIKDLSIEHKIPWLNSNNPKELYFDLDNIAFSHLKCNVSERRMIHPSTSNYTKGCRCPECKKLKSVYDKNYKEKL